jgi:hypothetical protein
MHNIYIRYNIILKIIISNNKNGEKRCREIEIERESDGGMGGGGGGDREICPLKKKKKKTSARNTDASVGQIILLIWAC